jgi:signal transduction histidine kinase
MCLLAALFMFTQGERMIYDWFPNMTAATFALIAYTTSTLVFTCIIHHLYYLMPDFVARKLLLWSRWLALFFFVTFVVLPVEYALYSAFLLLFHHSAILLYAMYVFVRSSRVRHPGSEYYLVACVAVILYFMQWVLNASFNVEIYRFPPIYVPIIVLSIGLALSEQQARLTKTLNASELARMRHQIKPHFIFNSLNTIIWMSKRDVVKTEQLLKNLSNYLRGSFDFDDREMMVPFYQEVDLTKAYLAIEQVRFAERLKVDWDIQTADFSLPPFILQPLVENAVHHGLQKVQSRDKGIRVQIRTTMTDSHYVLEVADDGAGFTQAQLVHWATENVEQFAIDGKGIGLKNIRIRLLKLYGTNLELARSEWGGALVTVRIPKKQ